MTTALLFDLDGTLVDTDHLHLEAFNQLFAEHGINVDRATYTAQIMGKPNTGIAEMFLPHMPAAESAALLSRKEALYRTMVDVLEPIPGLIELLDWAAARKIPCGVVTNAPRANAELVLGALGIAERFQTMVIGEELAQSKPHPLPYLTGLARLGAEAAHSVAFEDSSSGLRAAFDAKIPVVGMMTALSETAFQEMGATLAVADYRDTRLRALIERQLTLA